MHQALYRKYRPKSFDDVYGQEHITSVLRYEAEHQRFSHAYLFCGPRGTGKTTCAKILSKVINCEHPVNGEPCGECFSCLAIDEGNATDVLEMDAASNTGVDYIRDIKNEVSYAPALLKKRVYIIDEVHMLSIGAFNALLKTLEEPPEHVVFILATTEFHKLPATIVSRCQRFDFRRIKSDFIAERLKFIAEKEGITLDENAAKTIAKQSLGGMRDAISMFELCSSGGKDVTPERVGDVLGLTDIEILYKSATAVARNDITSIFSIIRTVDSSSKDIAVYFSELAGFWRDMLVFKYLPEKERASYLDLTEPEMRLLTDAARRFSTESLSRHFELLSEAMKEMARLPQTKRLTAELTMIRISDASLDSTPSAMLSRISALEEKLALIESGAALHESKNSPALTTNAETSTPDSNEVSGETNAENPIRADEKIEKTAENIKNQFHQTDLGDVNERIASQNPLCAGFLRECDCFVSDDGSIIKILAVNDFAVKMLTTESSLQSMRSAFRMCRIGETGAEIIVEVGAVRKSAPAIDELEEL